ncbi:DnaD domain protein [Bacillus sp. FJAT-49711]|uniref:DnaD domain protein n=1 Tax=Bacillus sp. FJAT-49711 TaxID=2833585 RepID=UPI001BCA211F|nr:DnaD domain protein [Bacillus sp. FJAT-49711]MBS4220076.1 DnaD domain protein [Bacillus sp. FJAT-49711]
MTMDKQYELVKQLENDTPEELLGKYSNVFGPSKEKIEAVEYMREYGMTEEVINALLYYILLNWNFKLSKNFMENLAIHLLMNKVSTTKNALDFTRMNHRKYQEWAEYEELINSKPKKQESLNDIERTILKSIELASKSSSTTDQDLGVFVRQFFK